ncbi:hypothetical protein KAH81_06160 [bacterium]|nr:hypothetical protein [bacterium]
MASRKDTLAGFLKTLKFENNDIRDSFQNRFRIQKYIYLLQEWKGYNWRYSYNVYLSGPYSTELAKEVYQVLDEDIISNTTTKLPQPFCEDLKEIQALTNSDEQLEALSTLLYISKSFQLVTKELDKIKSYALSRFSSVKPFISNDVRDEAWSIIENKKML